MTFMEKIYLLKDLLHLFERSSRITYHNINKAAKIYNIMAASKKI